MALGAAASGDHPFDLTAPSALLVVVVTGALCWIATRALHEDLMLANLGRGPAFLSAAILTPALLLEIAIALAGDRA